MNNLARGLKQHFNETQLTKLGSIKVAILGCGGLGSNLAFMLVRSGIRSLRLIDPDTVSASNLNRQAFFPEDVGLPKTLALSRQLLRLEPCLDIERLEKYLTPENCKDLVFGQGSANSLIVAEAVDSASVKAIFFERVRPYAAFYVTASGLTGLGDLKTTMRTRYIGKKTALVGDEQCGPETREPVLAPRVIEAAALQANAILRHILGQ